MFVVVVLKEEVGENFELSNFSGGWSSIVGLW